MPGNQLKISTPLSELSGVGESTKLALARLGLFNVADLLTYLPFRLEDRSKLVPINQLKIDEEVVISGVVKNVSSRKSKRGVLIIQATVEDETGKIPALWFNQRYLLRQLQPNQPIMLFGSKKLAPPLGNPLMVKAIISHPSVVPIYRSTKGLSQGVIRRLLTQVRPVMDNLSDLLPEEILSREQLPTRSAVLPRCHFEPTESDLTAAKQLLAFEELVLLGLSILQAKNKRQQQSSQAIKVDDNSLKMFADTLPFQLTDGQRRAAWEIIQDLAKGSPMNRLLYGEVGSGKTVVALLAAIAVIRSGRRVAFLAPTTTLAWQQASTAEKLLEPLGIKTALLTASQKDDYTNADLIIGTHALLQNSVQIDQLGLAIVDEQQRFGVSQRQHFLRNQPALPLLMMTATPIPRSLAQTVFGHLQISYLTDKPVHQQRVETIIFKETQRTGIEREIKNRISRGEPGYVICPLIESAETEETFDNIFQTERKAIKSELGRLTKDFPTARIAVLHGQLKAANKEQILRDFRAGEVDILLSTTVVEVGIDNPDASWILIEEADCFGLAQLHQLRGRVGRGAKASVCYLADSRTSPIGQERLEIIKKTTDGLKLAEYDLKLRGPGELIGYEQSGLPDLRYADWHELAVVKKAFAAAEKILEDGIDGKSSLAAAIKKFSDQTIA